MEEVKKIVRRLAERKWSKEVACLKCWAGVVPVGVWRRADSLPAGLIFAVKNVSK